jgi:hypothetical protein
LAVGRRRELYFFRDQQGLEVDFVMPGKGRHLHLLEVKSSQTLWPKMADPLLRLGQAIRSSKVTGAVIYQPPEPLDNPQRLRPGVRAGAVGHLPKFLQEA